MSNYYGFTPEEWAAAKLETKQILVARAKAKAQISYSDLGAKIKSVQFQARDHRLYRLLDEISEEEDASGRGMLSVIVIQKAGDMRPGDGYFKLANKLGRDTSDIEKCWVDEVSKVYECWKSK